MRYDVRGSLQPTGSSTTWCVFDTLTGKEVSRREWRTDEDMDKIKAEAARLNDEQRKRDAADAMYEALKKAEKYIDAIGSFYGQGLEVLNWHQNGDTQPWDSFFDDNSDGSELDDIRSALRLADGGE